MTTTVHTRPLVSQSLQSAPIIGVVRTPSREEAARRARLFAAAGIELVEITFSVPGAAGLVRELLAERTGDAPPWFGMGTVTTAARAREAVAAGAEFIVTPNVSAEVAHEARQANLFLVMGALTGTEIVAAHGLGADIIKVFPLPPEGGPSYLERSTTSRCSPPAASASTTSRPTRRPAQPPSASAPLSSAATTKRPTARSRAA
jgi:2-dehydro-3-deoxyphosphogluconate aldolase/(4S)-4-hydroxy-2-oxoglutarate aldolase